NTHGSVKGERICAFEHERANDVAQRCRLTPTGADTPGTPGKPPVRLTAPNGWKIVCAGVTEQGQIVGVSTGYLGNYLRVLAIPGVPRLLLIMFVARIPVTAVSMVLTLHVVLHLGHGYAAAGLVG